MATANMAKISKSLDQRLAREYRKALFSDWDRRFSAILFVTLCFEIMIVTWQVRRPIPEYSEREIANIQERFANFVLKGTPPRSETNVLTTPVGGAVTAAGEAGETGDAAAGGSESTVAGEGSGGGTGGGTGGGIGEGSGSGGTGTGRSVAASEARRISREAISREVSNKGLLGLITGTGSGTEGRQAVTGIFGSSGSGGTGGESRDLDRVLSSVGGLKTQGASGLGISGGGGGGGTGEGSGGGGRGGRSGRQTTIDDLVSDRDDVSTMSLTRKGDINLEAPAEVIGLGKKSVYRSPDAIQEVLLKHVSAVRYCYERELKRNPSLKGKVSVRITVATDGSVHDAVIVSSTLNNERVERCILTRIRRWNDFPPINPDEGDVTFRQVYTFGY